MDIRKKKLILIRKILLISWILIVAFLNLYHFPDNSDIGSHGKDKLGHFVISAMGFVISYLNSFSFLEAIFLVFGYSLFLECFQYYIPWRSFELLDLGADSIRIIFGIVFIYFYEKKYDLKNGGMKC